MDNEPRPILGMSIIFGSPFVIVGINQFLNPEINNSWPFSSLKAFALMMVPYLIKLALILLACFVIFKGVTSMLNKIKSWIEKERVQLRDTLLYRQENFESNLSNHLKEDRKKRASEFENLEKRIIQLLEEIKSPPMHISTESSTNTVIKNFA